MTENSTVTIPLSEYNQLLAFKKTTLEARDVYVGSYGYIHIMEPNETKDWLLSRIVQLEDNLRDERLKSRKKWYQF